MENQKVKTDCADIELLKWKIEIYISNEEYEKAATLKKWIDEIESFKDNPQS